MSREDERVQAIKLVLYKGNDSMSKTFKNKEKLELFDSILICALAISEDPSFEKTNIVGLQEDVLINIPNKSYDYLQFGNNYASEKLKKLYHEMENLKKLLRSETFFEDVLGNTTSGKPSLHISFSKK